MTTRFARFESCCRSWLMRSFRRAAKPPFANKSKWPAFPPNERLRHPSNSNSMKVMADIDPKLVKQLREKTNAGMMDCKRALEEAGSDLARAETILRTKGIACDQGRNRRFLHSFAGQGWRAGGSELRNRFCGQERKFPRLRQRHHAAHCGGTPALCRSRRRARKIDRGRA